MLELPGDLGFYQEPGLVCDTAGLLGLELLERDLAPQLVVVRQPDATDSAGGVQPDQGIALLSLGVVVSLWDRRCSVNISEVDRRTLCEGPCDGALGVVVGRRRALNPNRGFAQFLLDQVAQVRQFAGLEPAKFDQHFGK